MDQNSEVHRYPWLRFSLPLVLILTQFYNHVLFLPSQLLLLAITVYNHVLFLPSQLLLLAQEEQARPRGEGRGAGRRAGRTEL